VLASAGYDRDLRRVMFSLGRARRRSDRSASRYGPRITGRGDLQSCGNRDEDSFLKPLGRAAEPQPLRQI